MPTQKIDPKVIFASDAPTIDKPPVFSDKTKGWDVARANDGRPTIKEMNKVQQDTDLKILWLNENSVTPYDESIDYPDGAVALKDGSFKQLVSGAWVEFLDDFANKDEVKRGIANRYDPLLTYNSGERVVLTNGDIVKSTIDGNTNDPNADMTGWVNYEKEQEALNTFFILKSKDIRSVTEFGVKVGVNSTTQFQAAIDSGEALWIPPSNERYLVDSLNINYSNANISGTRKSILQGVTAGQNVFNIVHPTDGVIERLNLIGFAIRGDDVANLTGIYAPKLAHANIIGLQILRMADAAAKQGFGWCNNYERNEFSYGGNGLVSVAGENNNLNIKNNRIFMNTGVGVGLSANASVNIEGNTIERNSKIGLVLSTYRGVKIEGNYFEANGDIGDTYGGKLIKADVFLNGSATWDTKTLAFAYPVTSASIRNNAHSNREVDRYPYVLNAVDNCEIAYNYQNPTSTSNAFIQLLEVGGGLSSQLNLDVHHNTHPTPLFEFVDLSTGSNQSRNIYTLKSMGTVKRNALSQNILDFTKSGVGTSKRSLSLLSDSETIELTGAAVLTKTLNLDGEHKHFAGKTVYLYCLTYLEAAASTSNIRLQIGSATTTPSYTTIVNTEAPRNVVATLPLSGNVVINISQITSNPANKARISNLILQEVGVPPSEYSYPILRERIGSAPDTTGEYSISDRIFNSNPTTGQPIGWVYTATGWKSVGVIS